MKAVGSMREYPVVGREALSSSIRVDVEINFHVSKSDENYLMDPCSGHQCPLRDQLVCCR